MEISDIKHTHTNTHTRVGSQAAKREHGHSAQAED